VLLKAINVCVFLVIKYSDYDIYYLDEIFPKSIVGCLLYFSGRIPRMSLIQHSLYVGVVEKPPLPPLTGE